LLILLATAAADALRLSLRRAWWCHSHDRMCAGVRATTSGFVLVGAAAVLSMLVHLATIEDDVQAFPNVRLNLMDFIVVAVIFHPNLQPGNWLESPTAGARSLVFRRGVTADVIHPDPNDPKVGLRERVECRPAASGLANPG